MCASKLNIQSGAVTALLWSDQWCSCSPTLVQPTLPFSPSPNCIVLNCEISDFRIWESGAKKWVNEYIKKQNIERNTASDPDRDSDNDRDPDHDSDHDLDHNHDHDIDQWPAHDSDLDNDHDTGYDPDHGTDHIPMTLTMTLTWTPTMILNVTLPWFRPWPPCAERARPTWRRRRGATRSPTKRTSWTTETGRQTLEYSAETQQISTTDFLTGGTDEKMAFVAENYRDHSQPCRKRTNTCKRAGDMLRQYNLIFLNSVCQNTSFSRWCFMKHTHR